MLRKIGSTLRWSAILGAKFFQVFPLGTLTSIVLTFLAQLALIASLLLPLKIIMIMSNGVMPNVIPDFLTQFSQRTLVGVMTALAIGSFIFNNMASKATEKIAKAGIKRLEKRNEKLTLFENQDSLAANAYTRYSMGVASAAFFVLGLIILWLLYPEITGIIIAYISACIVGYSVAWQYWKGSRSKISENLPKQMNTLSNIGFLVVFLFIVIDFMIWEIPPFLKVLVSIILGRQIFSQFALFATSMHFVDKHQDKLRALFFRSQTFQPPSPQSQAYVWDFLSNPQLLDTICNIVRSIHSTPEQNIQISWRETGLPNILYLIGHPEDSSCKYLVKIFDRTKTAEARHEASLLIKSPKDLPAPKILSTTLFQGYHIHVFDISEYSFILKTPPNQVTKELEGKLLATTLSDTLISQYCRSRMMIWDRINNQLFQRLDLVANRDEWNIIDRFQRRFPDLKETIKTLPIVITNPSRNPLLCLRAPDGSFTATHWGKWDLEPIGAGWPMNSYGWEAALDVLEAAEKKNKELTSHELSKKKLSWQLGCLDDLISKQRYHSAINLMDDILKSLDNT